MNAARLLRLLMPAGIAAGLMLAAGCETLGGNRTLAGDPHGRQPARPDPRTEAARAASRIDQLEGLVQRLQIQVDGLSESQQHVAMQAEQRVAQSRQEQRALREELDMVRRELNTLRTEQQQFRQAIDDLPARVSRAVAAATPPTPPAPQRRAAAQQPAVGYEHVVESGQTLSEIARAYGVRVDAIVQANELPNAALIRAGQTLFIPKP